jgi:hypothetical protein
MELLVEFELVCTGWDPECVVTQSATAGCEQRGEHGPVSSRSPERPPAPSSAPHALPSPDIAAAPRATAGYHRAQRGRSATLGRDRAGRESLAFWLRDGALVARMNVNVCDATSVCRRFSGPAERWTRPP